MAGKFTPGPWEAQESPRDDMEAMEILSETRDEIAIVEIDSVDQDTLDETMANARLIAAAPDLLTACIEQGALIARMIEILGIAPDSGARTADVAMIAGKAIRKALGPSSPDVCPRCGSGRIVRITPAGGSGPAGWGARCKDCGESWSQDVPPAAEGSGS